MTPLLGRQGELLAQLHDLLALPPSVNKLESAVGGPLTGAEARTGGPPPAAAPSTTMAGGIGRRRRRGRSSEIDRDNEVTTNGEHHGEEEDPATRRHSYKRRKKKQEEGTTSMVVTSAPDLFDGYQWRKYGQKKIEGAMYPRSYYRCTRSAEQGCAAKRTVQRNADDAEDGGAAATPMYTVVRVGEHTCTANDSPEEAPVILETATAAAVIPAASCTSNNTMAPKSSSSAAAAASYSTTAAAAAAARTESLAISDNTLISSSIPSSDCRNCFVDDDCHGLLAAAAIHDNDDWVPTLAASSPSSLPRIEDFAGPIRSPVHISATDCWTIDHQFLLQLVNEPSQPTICLHQL